ncbi:Co2+/Mg2+ efflux protein ApaG [Vibrio sp. Of7-15]|uniref:Co2+/Mg2+ efflux protein ApaG n=1 Tax=Vibrio sp. Of7-15 TaxID=2724879 RepID=UPI001EF1CD77|nr:Co2+/Mg2+ efflux protein ApaG [Vibrio sp. Of7-15]MCG7498682.1 Co2+/Mg2+ efflux protein ApaG [Vibrio sp. Of7-15]
MDQPTIKCVVIPHYIAEQSEPENQRYVFSYTVTIKNLSKETVQLLRRRWLITDANEKKLLVEGDGVVGEQPVIHAKQEYSYTSATAIETPVGVMEGHYIMQDEEKTEFKAVIEPFRLAIPNILN